MHQLISLQEARRASLKRRPPAAECFLAHSRKQDLLTTRSTTALWRNLLPFLGALMGRASLCYYSVREAACRRENWLSIDFFRTRANTGMLCSCKLCSWVSPKGSRGGNRTFGDLCNFQHNSVQLPAEQKWKHLWECGYLESYNELRWQVCVWESWTEGGSVSCRLVLDTFKTICS